MDKVCAVCQRVLAVDCFGKHSGRKDGRNVSCRPCRSAERRAAYAANEALRAKISAAGSAYYAANKAAIAVRAAAYVVKNREAHNTRGRNWYHANIDKARESGRVNAAAYRQTEQGQQAGRLYYLANAARFKEYRAANAVHIAAGKHVKYELNKPAVLAQMKAYYESNKVYILARNKQYALDNPDVMRRSKRDWYYRNPGCSRLKEMRRRVRINNGTPFPITTQMIADLWHKQKGKCLYCRVPLGNTPQQTSAYHVDHIQPISKGGTNELHNLQCLCPPCNWKKGAKLPHVFAQERGRLF